MSEATPHLPTLRALEARLVAATGPDRSIDIAMWEAFEPHKYLYAQSERTWAVNRRGTALNPVWEMCADPRMPVTASIDAAVALIERVLPDYGWCLRRDDTDASGRRAAPVYNAFLLYPDALRVTPGGAQCLSPALALCLALVRAVIARLETEHG